ncbi:GNAT family N-acetyltransferase [Arthrobacter zhaoxinii]|uniref:GNAT family N-acetyltransferase n=1 Tax=Arthrobacter zhaoxinii TaxID=2964616 RepID=A0ABY5YP87_9MICC|nr:GNAT family N-acetyltransferase [Arthrobacter zhaoxinii]UWX95908.1 GNAT family N-acetyltransferase [Arthrobacter zhaoxinii]
MALLDGPELLRFAIDPTRRRDASLALRIVDDVNNPMAGILSAGAATIEARGAVALTEQLAQNDWSADEPWTPLHHDMAASHKASVLRVETVEPGHTAEWVAVHWSAFRGTPIPDERSQRFVDGWRLAAESPFLDLARILSLRCRDGHVVAAAAVWSAGEGRPGLIEPLAVHQEHRGRGYGTAMASAAVDALRQLGSSSAMVCAETSNAGAVATYLAAGFTAHREVADWHRSNATPLPVQPGCVSALQKEDPVRAGASA